MDCLVKNSYRRSVNNSVNNELSTGLNIKLESTNRQSSPSKSEDKKVKSKDDRSESPSEDKCPICLVVPIDDPSKANKCYHSFCKCCILEWAKVRMECPLCRQPFDGIIYDIKSDFEFKEYDRTTLITKFGAGRNASNSIMPPVMSPFLSQMFRSISSSAFLINQLQTRQMQRGTPEHRRYIYSRELYVQSSSSTSRRRESSGRFYRQNPACVHRLIPFLQLELSALINDPNENRMLTQLIIRSLTSININSTRFQQLISQFTIGRTLHFIHEFYNFAISTYDDMSSYFEAAEYVPISQARIVRIERSDSSALNYRDSFDNRSSRSVINDFNSVVDLSLARTRASIDSSRILLDFPTSLDFNSGYNVQSDRSSSHHNSNHHSNRHSNRVRAIVQEMDDSSDSDIDIVFEGKVSAPKAKPMTHDLANQSTSNQLTSNNARTATIIEDDTPQPSTSGLQRSNIGLNQLRDYTTDDSDSDYDDENYGRRASRQPFYESNDEDQPKNTNQLSEDLDDDDDSIEYVGFVNSKRPRTSDSIEIIELTDDEDEQPSTKQEVNEFKKLKTGHQNDQQKATTTQVESNDKAINCRCKVMCKFVCKKDD